MALLYLKTELWVGDKKAKEETNITELKNQLTTLENYRRISICSQVSVTTSYTSLCQPALIITVLPAAKCRRKVSPIMPAYCGVYLASSLMRSLKNNRTRPCVKTAGKPLENSLTVCVLISDCLTPSLFVLLACMLVSNNSQILWICWNKSLSDINAKSIHSSGSSSTVLKELLMTSCHGRCNKAPPPVYVQFLKGISRWESSIIWFMCEQGVPEAQFSGYAKLSCVKL